jgi:ABC-type antimicrobial peptide transport system permease subunit
MIKNYLKTCFRNLVKNKAHSFINIAGLSIGMAVAILIGLWIWDEVSFDKYHKNYDRIAQVMQNVTNNNQVATWQNTPYPLADELRKNYGSDFTNIVMAAGSGNHILSFGDKRLSKTGVYFESKAPEVFTLKMLKGSWDGLKEPGSILLSASVAKSFFGDADPMDRLLKIDNTQDVKVTGVYEDLPLNSTFNDITFIAPWQLYFNTTNWIKTASDPWRPNAFQLYVQLTENADIKKVSDKIRYAKLNKVNAQLVKKKPVLFLQPMSKWHLYSEFKNGVNTGGGIRYVRMFSIIGLFVLLLACINFMNLSTARSEKRAKEVGIRKAVGSLRGQLIYRFFSESFLMVTLSFAFSLLLVQLLLPFFNDVSGKQMSILWSNPLFWIMCLAVNLITGFVAGSYPAFYLSSFQPVKILKGTFKAGRLAAIPRKVLVVVQFTVSIAMIISTVIVFRQIQFTKNRPLGHDNNGLIAMPMINHNIHDHFDAVKSELIQTGAITAMAESGGTTTQSWNSTSGIDWKGKDPNLSIDFLRSDVSYDYGKMINWQIKEGRDFSRDFASDSSGLIINEAAADFMGLKNPIGETIKWFGTPYTVIGVVKNMVVNSPYDEVRPSVYDLATYAGNFVTVKINPDKSAAEALRSIETVYKKFNPEQPFEYQFADDEYANKFRAEERVGKLAGFFAMLAILISCLGLFGMASFMAEQRTKEIGIRKVLGASVFNLWGLLSKDFVVLITISLVIAVPTAYYFMNDWLQNYDYRSTISWWIFAIAGLSAMTIALLTVSFQSIKASIRNPVKSLRTE